MHDVTYAFWRNRWWYVVWRTPCMQCNTWMMESIEVDACRRSVRYIYIHIYIYIALTVFISFLKSLLMGQLDIVWRTIVFRFVYNFLLTSACACHAYTYINAWKWWFYAPIKPFEACAIKYGVYRHFAHMTMIIIFNNMKLWLMKIRLVVVWCTAPSNGADCTSHQLL